MICIMIHQPKQTKSDTWDCGVYCLKYLESLTLVRVNDELISLTFLKFFISVFFLRARIYTKVSRKKQKK
jgi:hypothetical protein